MGFLRIVGNLLNGSSDIQKGVAKWGILGAGATSGISLVAQYLKHNSFEKKCDKYWEKYEFLIIKDFFDKIEYELVGTKDIKNETIYVVKKKKEKIITSNF